MNSVDRMIARGKALVLRLSIRGTDRWMGTKQLVDPGKIEPYYRVALTTWGGSLQEW